MKTLTELLDECDKLWEYDISVAFTYNYTLGKFPAGWQFSVTNSWYKWSDAGLKYTFGVYKFPVGAVMAFLDYVKKNHIDVKSLADRTSIEEFDKILNK